MKNYLWIMVFLLLFVRIPGAIAARQDDSITHPPCVEEEIPHYVANRTTTKPKIDGRGVLMASGIHMYRNALPISIFHWKMSS